MYNFKLEGTSIIQEISFEEGIKLIYSKDNVEHFWLYFKKPSSNEYIAVENSQEGFYIEEFLNDRECIDYLLGEEKENIIKRRECLI